VGNLIDLNGVDKVTIIGKLNKTGDSISKTKPAESLYRNTAGILYHHIFKLPH